MWQLLLENKTLFLLPVQGFLSLTSNHETVSTISHQKRLISIFFLLYKLHVLILLQVKPLAISYSSIKIQGSHHFILCYCFHTLKMFDQNFLHVYLFLSFIIYSISIFLDLTNTNICICITGNYGVRHSHREEVIQKLRILEVSPG